MPIQEAEQAALFKQRGKLPERMLRLCVKQLDGRDAMGCRMDGVMGRLGEHARFRVLKGLERLHIRAPLVRIGRECADHVQDVRGVGAAVFVDAKIPRAFRVLPVPAP
jgi:hypothetical protein